MHLLIGFFLFNDNKHGNMSYTFDLDLTDNSGFSQVGLFQCPLYFATSLTFIGEGGACLNYLKILFSKLNSNCIGLHV